RQSAKDDNAEREQAERKNRAVHRLVEYGYPRLAWRFLLPDDDVAKLGQSRYPDGDQARLALATGNYLRLLRQRESDWRFRSAAAEALHDDGRPEQKEEVEAFLLGRLFPAAAPAAPYPGDGNALDRWWDFVTAAGMEQPVRLALARRCVAAHPGAWSA